MTSEDKRQMYLQQKQNEIRHGLLTIDGVADATVILQLPDTDSFVLSGSEKRGSASLIVKMKSGAEALSRSKVNGIISFVSKSVGIKEEDVEVLDEGANPLTQSQEQIGENVGSAYELQQKYSQDIEQKVSKLLNRMFGKGSVEVIASVNINTSSQVINSTEVTPVDEENIKGIVSSMQEIRKNWVDAASGGVPGTDTNTDINQYVETETGKAEYSEINQTINYEFNEIKKQIVEEVGNIEDLSLAVTINNSALKEGVDVEALKQELNNLVVNATKAFVPQKTSQEHLSNITIAVSEFDNSLDVAYNDQLEREANQQRMDNMIKIGSVAAAMLILGLSMFLFIRRRSGMLYEEELELQEAVAAAAAPSMPIEEIDIEDRNELKKKLEKFVGQKPDQVATLLKSWLNEE
jgi:flagellar M-ring protein FliF